MPDDDDVEPPEEDELELDDEEDVLPVPSVSLHAPTKAITKAPKSSHP